MCLKCISQQITHRLEGGQKRFTVEKKFFSDYIKCGKVINRNTQFNAVHISDINVISEIYMDYIREK